MDNFNFFQTQMWNNSKNLLHPAQQQPPRGEITSTEKSIMSTASSNSILAPSKLAQVQPPHSTNRVDITSLVIDNRLYLDGLRQQQQARQNNFTNGSLTISQAGGSSRDNNNNGLSNQSMSFSSQKMLNRLDIDTIRSLNSHRNTGSCSGGNNVIQSHQHGTILFNTLNGGALGAGNNSMMPGSSAECFNGPDLVESTTPPLTAILMPPVSSASSSSTVSTNIGLNRNSSHDGHPEKIKTPNSIRGKGYITRYFETTFKCDFHSLNLSFTYLLRPNTKRESDGEKQKPGCQSSAEMEKL